MSAKRPRSSTASDTSTPPTVTASPPPKAYRTSTSPQLDTDSQTTTNSNTVSHPLLCTLPPTCQRRPTPIENAKDLETHYAKYHAHVCEQPGCACVFPEPRLLELHQTECHDPLAEIRKEKGEKIFACHLASCPKLFSTPKTRRLHLIQAHGFPKEYFFAVTNKGVGGLLKKWGEGASLIRGHWKGRPSEDSGVSGHDKGGEAGESDTAEVQSVTMDEDSDQVGDATPRNRPAEHLKGHEAERKLDNNIDALADSMSSLSLVPPSIRFGRGGKRGGFGHQNPTSSSHSLPFQPQPRVVPVQNGTDGHHNNVYARKPSTEASVDEQGRARQHQQNLPVRGRGRGGRGVGLGPRAGRGRAGFHYPRAVNGHVFNVRPVVVMDGGGGGVGATMRGNGSRMREPRGRGRGRGGHAQVGMTEINVHM